ncbi:MAG TPA: choice-of-anchor O protein [Pseudomonadales bacterium]
MTSAKHKTLQYALIGVTAVAGIAYAATQIGIFQSITLSQGTAGHKPKIQRMGNNRLVVAYGDNTPGAGTVYDVKGQAERPARDIYVRSCMPSDSVSCNNPTDWSAPLNISNSALQSSIQTAWKANDNTLYDFAGDAAKPNIKTSGQVVVLSWVSKYCPDGDISTLGVVDGVSEQRAIKYLERDGRTVPFSCTWMARSTDMGASWSAPVQLSTGLRDAIQDASSGSFNSTTKKGQVVISWQEDPQGLKLGEADGPGDGASGANVNGGTDVWYTYATVDLSVPATPADDFDLQQPMRLTDNFTGQYGVEGTLVLVYDGTGNPVDPDTVEKGQAGASRPNIGISGSTTILAYEETKGSQGLDEGKFIRYHAFAYNTPPVADAGCIISNPLKNARRVRFLTQSATDAGVGGTQIAVFWKEGIYDKGGPSDIVVRRGIDGLLPANMTPAVDHANCETSVYDEAIALASTPGDNISSNTPEASSANLTDDTEAYYTENALAHRGVLRGKDLWIGFNYTADLVNLWAQLDNYNFWVRYMDTGTGLWQDPVNLSNITDTAINVREPRFVGTPKSSSTACPSGDPLDVTTTDPTLCQDTQVIWVAWGTQTNVSPYDLDGGQDLGEYITASTNGGATFQDPVRLSEAQGTYFYDDESAFEAQVVLRPDGRRFYAVWNQENLVTGNSFAQYTSGDLDGDSDPVRVVHGTLQSESSDQAGSLHPLMLAMLGLLALLRRRLLA